MQLSALLFTQLPQYLLNLTGPSATSLSASITNPSLSILPEDMAKTKFTLPALPYAYDVFWANLAPADTSQAKPESAPKLTEAISAKYGSYDGFKDEFTGVLLGLQGSGWGWLVKNEKTEQLDIVITKDQDPVVGGLAPIFGIDMWEHAYYLQYFNDKASYVNGIWNIINWDTAEGRYLGGRGGL
ncbi:hypothetical protein C7212DRAFT_327428, partial [Tuber magnatum]